MVSDEEIARQAWSKRVDEFLAAQQECSGCAEGGECLCDGCQEDWCPHDEMTDDEARLYLLACFCDPYCFCEYARG